MYMFGLVGRMFSAVKLRVEEEVHVCLSIVKDFHSENNEMTNPCELIRRYAQHIMCKGRCECFIKVVNIRRFILQ